MSASAPSMSSAVALPSPSFLSWAARRWSVQKTRIWRPDWSKSVATAVCARPSTVSPARSGVRYCGRWRRGGEMVVYGALSTHRQTDPDKLVLPVFARSLIYGTKVVRGFWLYRWFTTTPSEQIGATLTETVRLVASGTVQIPEGQPLPLEDFADAVRLAE